MDLLKWNIHIYNKALTMLTEILVTLTKDCLYIRNSFNNTSYAYLA